MCGWLAGSLVGASKKSVSASLVMRDLERKSSSSSLMLFARSLARSTCLRWFFSSSSFSFFRTCAIGQQSSLPHLQLPPTFSLSLFPCFLFLFFSLSLSFSLTHFLCLLAAFLLLQILLTSAT